MLVGQAVSPAQILQIASRNDGQAKPPAPPNPHQEFGYIGAPRTTEYETARYTARTYKHPDEMPANCRRTLRSARSLLSEDIIDEAVEVESSCSPAASRDSTPGPIDVNAIVQGPDGLDFDLNGVHCGTDIPAGGLWTFGIRPGGVFRGHYHQDRPVSPESRLSSMGRHRPMPP